MRTNVVEIPSIKWENQRKLSLDKGFRCAVRDYLRRRWPTGTAKAAARAFNLSADRAREAVAGNCSLTSLETICKTGGPAVSLPILEEVWGHSLMQFINERKQVHAEHAERLGALVGDHWPLASPGSADPADHADAMADREGARRSRLG